MCEPLTRRQALRYGALVAMTFPAARLLDGGWALAHQARPQMSGAPVVPMNLELVTVTDTEAVITWFTGDPTALDAFNRPTPVEAPGRVLIGTNPNPTTWVEVGAHGPTAYHHVVVTGLSPTTTYFWRAESNGVPATGTVLGALTAEVAAPPAFTTLTPPPGREIGRVAWLNDLHIGENTSGLALSNGSLPGGGLPPGFPVDPANPYWRTMATAAVAEARAQGCDLMLVNGDLTSEAEPPEVAEARQILDTFGTLGRTTAVTAGGAPHWFVTRGNHDRAHSGATWAACSHPHDLPDHGDCLRDAFADGFTSGDRSRFSVALDGAGRRFRFVGLDSNDLATGSGVMPNDELDYLEAELARGEATFTLFHHPVSDLGTTLSVPPVTFGVEQQQATRFRELVRRHPNVAAVYNAHTHRNLRITATDTGNVPYFEGGAVKEYPGGYTTVRLYEGGYMVNFWKAADPEARAWSERSRGEYLNLYPYYTLGGLSDRNWVVRFSSSATPLAGSSGARTGTGTSEGGTTGGSLAATGTGLGGAGVGAAALAVGLAARGAARDPADA